MAVLLSDTQTHRAAAEWDTHADKHFESSHTARRWFSLPRSPGFSPVWFGQHSTKEEEEVCLRNEGKRSANSRESARFIWLSDVKHKGARPNKQCLNATFCKLRISSVMCARFSIRSTGGNKQRTFSGGKNRTLWRGFVRQQRGVKDKWRRG